MMNTWLRWLLFFLLIEEHVYSYENVDSDDMSSLFSRNRTLTTSVEFVSYPHQRIFDGFLELGTFIAGNVDIVKDKLYGMDYDHLDNIQLSAIRDGIFIPKRSHFPKYHLFSSKEANQCIQGKKIYFFGDSYSRQMFLGFVEILLNEPSNDEIKGAAIRENIIDNMALTLQSKLDNDTVVKLALNECRSYKLNDMTCLLHGVENDHDLLNADALLGNVLIHHMTLHKKEINHVSDYLDKLHEFMMWNQKHKISLSWVTGCSYTIDVTADEFTTLSKSHPTVFINTESMKLGKQTKTPVLDVFSLTYACQWENCTSDINHRSRFVNRMKAQMILNNLCTINS